VLEDLLVSGQVRFFGMSDCARGGPDGYRFVSRLTGEAPVRRAYGHRPTGLTWAMAWAGTVMMPLEVRTLMASAGPLTSGPHQA
jgi:hypothetical protein